jgi:hypothetical protein
VNESLALQSGPADKHDEPVSRNRHDSDGADASERTRADEDGETPQDEHSLTIRQAPSLTEIPSSNGPADETKKHDKKKPDDFEADSKYLEALGGWIKSPETFFDEDVTVKIGPGIYQFVNALEKSQDLNAIKLKYTLRQLALSRDSWSRTETKEFIAKLTGDAINAAAESTIRSWIKEGHLYHFLCQNFGNGCLFCDVVPRKE